MTSQPRKPIPGGKGAAARAPLGSLGPVPPPRTPSPALHSPIPFRLSCLGGEGGEGKQRSRVKGGGEESRRGESKERAARRGFGRGGAGSRLATENLVHQKRFWMRPGLEQYQVGFWRDAWEGSGVTVGKLS